MLDVFIFIGICLVGILCALLIWMVFVAKNEDGSNQTILERIKKLVGIIGLFFLYFFIPMLVGTMSTDSCREETCRFQMIGLIVGFLWILVSYIFTVLSLQFSRFNTKYFKIFHPAFGIVIFFIILYVGVSLDDRYPSQALQKSNKTTDDQILQSQNLVTELDIEPVVTLDTTTLVNYSERLVLSGSAIGVSSIFVSLANQWQGFWHSETPVVVVDGKWSVVVSIPDYTIPPGQYEVIIAGPDNPHNELPSIARYPLTVTD